MPGNYMNPAYGAMMEGAGTEKGEKPTHAKKGPAAHSKPHIFIHSHSGGHTVHIHHPDGRHEMHGHPHGDADGIAQHIHDHLGEGSAPEGHEAAGDEMLAGGR